MKALIIDNEKTLREGLADLLKLFCADVTEIELASDIKSGIEKILLFKPQIVFLDVELDEGTGMDLLRKLEKISFHLVFVTAHNKYAVDAFKFSAIDFLLKPVNPEELVRSVERAKTSSISSTLLDQLKQASEGIKNPSAEKKLVLKELDVIHIIKADEIVYCEADGIYTTFHLSNNTQIVVSKNIKEYEDILVNLNFLRAHKSFLVNMNKVKKFEKGDGGFLIMDNEARVPVSQRKREQLLALFKNM